MISKEIILEIGKKKGLVNKEHIEKNYFQDILLFNLYKKTNKFVFKGGTALYKFYGLPRFSEDLDFSLVEDLNQEEIIKIIKETVENVDFFKIKSMKNIQKSILFKIACKGIITKYNSIRMDINLKNKILKEIDIKNYTSDFIDILPFSLKLLNPEEIIAEKIHSLYNREKARDLFDLFFLLRQFNFNESLVKEKLEVFNIHYNKNVLKKRIKTLEKIWEKELKPFILIELPEFEIVKHYVFDKIKL